MSNSLLKKVTAAVALTAIVSSTIGSVSSTYASTAELEAAAKLADAGVITTASDYRLGDTITRREMLKVMVNLSGLTVENKCEGKFTDLPATDWGCKYAEAALAKGFIAANAKFRPNDNVSKAEAVKMVMKAKGLEKDATAGLSWEAAYVKAAVAAKLVDTAFTDYSTASKRGFTIVTAANAIDSSDDLGLDDLLDGTDDVDSSTGTTDDTDTDTTVATGDLTVDLSAETPTGADLPKGADGVHVLSFDLTAGSEDASLTDLTFDRSGFGEDSAKAVYLFTESGRISKSKTFNSDDEANVTISPALIVKAGETVTVKVLVDTDSTKTGEFAVSLKNLNGEAISDVESNTFDVKDTVATILNFNTGSVDTKITAGEIQSDVAEFDLENDGNVTNSDISVSTITLKEQGTIGEEYLDNLTLVVAGKEVATASMNGKYVTFNLDTPVVIKDGKTTTFTVRADLLGGAWDDIKFVLDTEGDIVATATKYNAVNVVSNYAGTSVDVEAGELTLYAIDATNDKVRDDTDNVVLGQLKVVNVAGQNLELKDLGLKLTTTNSGVLSVLENVQIEFNGSSYDLTAPSTTAKYATFSETDLDIVLPQGTSVFTVVADTLDNLTDGETISMELNASSTSTFKVEETEDDNVVTDLTPSLLTWDDVEVQQPEVTISKVSLADVSVVKGADDITALQFDAKSNEVSDLDLDKVVVNVAAKTSTGATDTDRKNYVSAISLYKGSVSEANLLDSVNGTKIAGDGNVTFDWFNAKIAADSTQTFVVVISTVDTDSVIGGSVRVSLPAASQTYLSIEDDNNDDAVFYSATGITGKLITLQGAGALSLNSTGSTDNTDNEQAKTILAGSTQTVFSIDAKATNETIDISKLTFNVDTDLTSVVSQAKLYLGSELVATASNSDITSGSIVFDDMTKTIIPTTSTELKLALVTEAYGFEKVNQAAVSGVTVTSIFVDKDDAKWSKSNEKLSADQTIVTSTVAKDFAVVPGVITPAVSNTFATDDLNSNLTLVTDFGNNTNKIDWASLTTTLKTVKVEVSSVSATGTITVFNGAGAQVGTANVTTAGTVSITIDAGEYITSGEVYRLETTAQASFRLAKDGVVYTIDAVDYSTNLKTTQDLGTYAKSN